jgi:hypothetical protein
MRILSFLVVIIFLAVYNQKTSSPHGKDFNISCGNCHSAKSWQLDTAIYSFDHNRTKLPLKGQHLTVTCRQCHKSLVFSEAGSECVDCHADVHQSTTGPDCSRCHTSFSWLVNNITEIHQASRFPLLGAHRMADCIDCHKSESMVRFDVPGVNCIDCHRDDYLSTTNPNHIQSGFSEDCSVCHPVNSFQWAGAGFNHNFFPLVQGHSGVQCSACHTSGSYSGVSADCYSCHQNDYTSTTNPDHVASNFPTACQNCHTLSPGWKPASFDHTIFPLTLGHSIPSCSDCHVNGNYNSTPTDCFTCHKTDYDGSINPNHLSLGFSTQCTLCHTTNPDWKPAKYTQHDAQFFPIYSGNHKGTWTLCSECHTDPNNYTTFDCIRCHSDAHRDKNYTNAECYSCHPRGSED